MLSSVDQEETCINDYLTTDELLQIFNVLPHTHWFNVISVCKSWCTISLQCFKPKTLSVLSHEWTGWTKWETKQKQPVQYSPQSVTTNMKFSAHTQTVTGKPIL